jgi:hypothetical protein
MWRSIFSHWTKVKFIESIFESNPCIFVKKKLKNKTETTQEKEDNKSSFLLSQQNSNCYGTFFYSTNLINPSFSSHNCLYFIGIISLPFLLI